MTAVQRLRGAIARRSTAAAAFLVVAAVLVVTAVAMFPRQASSPQGLVTKESTSCPCTFSYPASWFFEAGAPDQSKASLGLHNYDGTSAAHLPIPTRFADIGINWLCDPGGVLYRATVRARYSPFPARRLVVAGYPAVSYAHWTAAVADGGVYEQQVYLYVPEYARDYNISLLTGNPPGRDIAAMQQVFHNVIASLHITSASYYENATTCVPTQPSSSPAKLS